MLMSRNTLFIKYKSLVYNRFSWISILFILYSLALYFSNYSMYKLNVKSFTTFSFVSYFFWTEIGVLLQYLHHKIRMALITLLSFLWVLVLSMGYFLFREFKEFLSTGLLIFLRDQPVYFWSYTKHIVMNPLSMGAIVVFTLLFVFLFKKKVAVPSSKAYILVSILILMVVNWKLNTGKIHHQKDFIPMDIHTFYSVKLGMKDNDKLKPFRHIFTPDLPILVGDKSREYRWNIVLIVFESFSKEPLSFYGFDNDYTPFMHRWIQTEQDQFILMHNAMSISGATDVSMPSMYTGVGPEEAYSKLISAPFLWDYAKKNDYETLIATSQSQEWKGFKEYIEDENLDHYFYPEKLKLPLINDVGADDLTVLENIENEFVSMKYPFFFYYNTNATHGPYQNKSPKIKDYKGIKSRYGRALFITDKIVEKIVNVVKKRGELDKTIFIFTADHGDYTVKRRQRLSSFFKEALDIPMMFRFPKSWTEKHATQMKMIQENSGKTVTNLDIAPTIYELLYAKKASKNSYFSGRSLFDTISANRLIICLSTNDTRHYSAEGFGFYKGDESFIFHDNTGFHYYDIKNDPKQLKDVIDSIAPNKRKYYDSIILHNRYLKLVLDRHRK